MGSAPTDPGREDPPSLDSRGVFVAIVSEQPDGEETCSISPWPSTERELLSEWVSARDESFVSLAEMR